MGVGGDGGHLVRNTHLSRQQRECKRLCQHQEGVVQFKPFAKKISLPKVPKNSVYIALPVSLDSHPVPHSPNVFCFSH